MSAVRACGFRQNDIGHINMSSIFSLARSARLAFPFTSRSTLQHIQCSAFGNSLGYRFEIQVERGGSAKRCRSLAGTCRKSRAPNLKAAAVDSDLHPRETSNLSSPAGDTPRGVERRCKFNLETAYHTLRTLKCPIPHPEIQARTSCSCSATRSRTKSSSTKTYPLPSLKPGTPAPSWTTPP